MVAMATTISSTRMPGPSPGMEASVAARTGKAAASTTKPPAAMIAAQTFEAIAPRGSDIALSYDLTDDAFTGQF